MSRKQQSSPERHFNHGKANSAPNVVVQNWRNTIPYETKHENRWALKAWNTWARPYKDWPRVDAQDKPLPKPNKYDKMLVGIEDMDTDLLNHWVAKFIMEACRPESTVLYPATTVTKLVLCLQSYLSDTIGRVVRFTECPTFKPIQAALYAKGRRTKRDLSADNAEFQRADIDKMWETKQLGDHNPAVLVRTLIFLNRMNFGLHNVFEHSSLRYEPAQIMLKDHQLVYTKDSRNGAIVVKQPRDRDNPDRCHVRLYQKYMNLSPKTGRDRYLYLKPLKDPSETLWYSSESYEIYFRCRMSASEFVMNQESWEVSTNFYLHSKASVAGTSSNCKEDKLSSVFAKLLETKQLGDHDPATLLRTIIYLNRMNLNIDPVDQHNSLKYDPAQITVQGEQLVYHAFRQVAENRGRVVRQQTDNSYHLRLYKKYMDLSPTTGRDEFFYLEPLEKPTETLWYSTEPYRIVTYQELWEIRSDLSSDAQDNVDKLVPKAPQSRCETSKSQPAATSNSNPSTTADGLSKSSLIDSCLPKFIHGNSCKYSLPKQTNHLNIEKQTVPSVSDKDMPDPLPSAADDETFDTLHSVSDEKQPETSVGEDEVKPDTSCADEEKPDTYCVDEEKPDTLCADEEKPDTSCADEEKPDTSTSCADEDKPPCLDCCPEEKLEPADCAEEKPEPTVSPSLSLVIPSEQVGMSSIQSPTGSPHRHDDVTVTRSVTMDKAPNKRPADAEQTVDTFAVCSNCSRLSYNLKQCDKCGSPLSEDNASMCVSAEPKRSRLDNSITATNGNVVNGSSTNGDGSASPTATSSSAVPIPQALYVNKNASMSQESTIRPQALYVNVNNSRFTASTTTSTDTVLTTSVADGPSTASVAPRVAPPPLVSTTTTTTTTSFSTFNLPPPPPYNTGPAVTTATTAAPAPAAPTDASDDSSGGAVIGELSINNESVAMPATQIRIGTRKFLPASSVTFKEDGVLFALKDFTHAPVLLNARAIIKCQANLDQYPVFFVFLEATCIRQIRNIFNLTIDEFQENSTANLKKCITIFPNITPTTSKDTRARMTATIRKIFGHMSSRYPRPGAYLDEISNMDTIDMLFDSMRNQRTSEVIPPTPRAAQTSAQPTPNTFSSSRLVNSSGVQRGIPQSQASVYVGGDVSRMPNAATAASNNMIRFQIPAREAQPGQGTPRTMMQTVQPRPGMTARHVTPRMVNSGIRQTSTTTATVQSAAATKPATPSAGTTAPLLVVPSDNQKWREMQKDLVEGGVYHVELPNKERKYYLWDGSRLVPCLVQNTEVQLNCIYCRIGSLRADVTTAKVRADEPSGISCTIKSEHTGQQPLNLSLNMISSVTTYFDNNICVMFVSLNYNGWWTVQNSLRLGGERDPCFNPNSPEARRKHLVYMFKNVNTDQRDALLGIKHKYGGTNVFMTAPQSIIYKNIGDIMRNIWHFQGKKMNRTINYEAPIPDFISIDRAGMVADDDDDDVIMTSEEVGVKCPYTQQVMKEPVKNKLCEHNYEKIAIQEFIVRKKGNAKCPYAGCGNTKPLSMLDLIDNQELRAYIKKQQAGKT